MMLKYCCIRGVCFGDLESDLLGGLDEAGGDIRCSVT